MKGVTLLPYANHAQPLVQTASKHAVIVDKAHAIKEFNLDHPHVPVVKTVLVTAVQNSILLHVVNVFVRF